MALSQETFHSYSFPSLNCDSGRINTPGGSAAKAAVSVQGPRSTLGRARRGFPAAHSGLAPEHLFSNPHPKFFAVNLHRPDQNAFGGVQTSAATQEDEAIALHKSASSSAGYAFTSKLIHLQTTQRLLISPAPPVCTATIAALPCCCFLTHVHCLSHRHHVVTTLAAQGLILEGRSSQT